MMWQLLLIERLKKKMIPKTRECKAQLTELVVSGLLLSYFGRKIEAKEDLSAAVELFRFYREHNLLGDLAPT